MARRGRKRPHVLCACGAGDRTRKRQGNCTTTSCGPAHPHTAIIPFDSLDLGVAQGKPFWLHRPGVAQGKRPSAPWVTVSLSAGLLLEPANHSRSGFRFALLAVDRPSATRTVGVVRDL